MNGHGQSPEVSFWEKYSRGALGGVFVCMCLPYVVLQYCWIKPAASEPQRASGPRRRALPSTVRGKAAFRIGIYVYIHFSCSMFQINTDRLHVTPCYCLPSQTKHSKFSISGCTPKISLLKTDIYSFIFMSIGTFLCFMLGFFVHVCVQCKFTGGFLSVCLR